MTARPSDRGVCGTMPIHRRLLDTVPEYGIARDKSETKAWEAMRGAVAAPGGITEVPVVVHVLYNTPAENISEAQIYSQIDVLNHDFRATNRDVGQAPSVFAPLVADARVSFHLATVDPAGNPTNGITRTATAVDVFPFDVDPDPAKWAVHGGHDAWPSDRYLNIWVCNIDQNILGYTTFPGGAPEIDGCVIDYAAFGTMGTATSPYNLGRVTTHEVGHWLNLQHIWGDDGSGCSGTDNVDDTPNQASENFYSPSFPHITCDNGPNGDMFMNHMDYTDDRVKVMFTQGQVTRMQACFEHERTGFSQSGPAPAPGPYVTTDQYNALKDATKVGFSIGTEGSSVDITVDDLVSVDSHPISTASVTLLTVGTCTLDADQPGDDTWPPAPQVARSFEVTTAYTYTGHYAWDAPEDNGGCAIDKYRAVDTTTNAVVYEGADPTFLRPDLNLSVCNAVKVAAHNCRGWGSWSKPSQCAKWVG